MARYTKHEPKIRGKGLVMVTGSFRPNTASAISSTYFKGNGWSAAYTSTGLFTVTFDEPYYELVSAFAQIQLASDADTEAQIGTWTASTRALQIRVHTAGTLANIAAAANNAIHFLAVFRESNNTKG